MANLSTPLGAAVDPPCAWRADGPGPVTRGKLANLGLSQNHHFWECAAGQL